VGESWVGLYKIFVYFEAFLYESTIVSFPAMTCIAHPGAILLRDYWAVYDPPSDPPLYAINYTILLMTRSCKSQVRVNPNARPYSKERPAPLSLHARNIYIYIYIYI